MTPDPAASPIDFERAGEADLEALAELMNIAYGGTGDIAGWTHVKDFLVGNRTSVSALRVICRLGSSAVETKKARSHSDTAIRLVRLNIAGKSRITQSYKRRAWSISTRSRAESMPSA